MVSPSRWHENLILPNVLETTHISCFAMTFISFWKFLEVWVLYDAKQVFSVMSDKRVTRDLDYLESGESNSYFLFYDDFDASCTFSKLTSCRTYDQFSPLWVTGELDFSGLPKDKSYFLLHDEFSGLSTFWKFEPSTTKTTFARYKWHKNSALQKVLEITHTSCLTMCTTVQQAFSVMSDVRTHSFRKCLRQLIPPFFRWIWCVLFLLQLSLVRSTTHILRYEWHEDSAFQKISWVR